MRSAKNNNICIRLDAGTLTGYGHLARCLSLALELSAIANIFFIIKTDDPARVKSYMHDSFTGNSDQILFLENNIPVREELEYVKNKISAINAFLIIDHYGADEKYQTFLAQHNIQWLQFDSHARYKFLADILIHASPAATEEMYLPLLQKENVKLLLGTKYAMVSERFRQKRIDMKVREKLRKVFICFGGGDDRGTANKCLDLVGMEKCDLEFNLFVSSNNANIDSIIKKAKLNNNISLNIDSKETDRGMAGSDLAIITPGTLSYEAACLGLPMLLIKLADNQDMNAIGWVNTGSAIYVGSGESIQKSKLNHIINNLKTNPRLLKKMSEKSMASVDGKGAERVKNAIQLFL